MSNFFADFLDRSQREVEGRLHACVESLPADRLRDAMGYSLFNGGKRIRPALCYATAEVCGDVNELTHRAAAALELIHTYSLIHDDLPAMDNDELRRGKPTCHIAFDEATAILAGDALQALAFEILSAPADAPPGRQLRLVHALARASGGQGMVLGQSLDLAAVDKQLTYSRLEAMHRHKTGALISASLDMGAIASGCTDDKALADLADYGAAIGLAFQVQDDILDVESSTETLGKTQGSDSALNKPTYTSLLGLDGAKEKLEELHTRACEAAKQFGQRGELLRAIADFIVQRRH